MIFSPATDVDEPAGPPMALRAGWQSCRGGQDHKSRQECCQRPHEKAMRAVTEIDLVEVCRPAGAVPAREIPAGPIARQGHQDEIDAGEEPERK